MSNLRLTLSLENWPLAEPFAITGIVWRDLPLLLVRLDRGGHVGIGEAAGVYYKADRPHMMLAQLEGLRPAIEAGLNRAQLSSLLPPGGTRNALDCALWALEASEAGMAVSDLAGLQSPMPLTTTFTCGADTPHAMAAKALSYEGATAIKLKLTGETEDAARVAAVRAALPEAWLAVDANQGLTPRSYRALLPTLIDCDVKLVEQPFPFACDADLDGLDRPIPIAADESFQSLTDLPRLAARYDIINIKLDKCGGLTEALDIVDAARAYGLGVMVGNMLGTSLAMAPAFLVGQRADIVDLDGCLFLQKDRANAVVYDRGKISVPPATWQL